MQSLRKREEKRWLNIKYSFFVFRGDQLRLHRESQKNLQSSGRPAYIIYSSLFFTGITLCYWTTRSLFFYSLESYSNPPYSSRFRLDSLSLSFFLFFIRPAGQLLRIYLVGPFAPEMTIHHCPHMFVESANTPGKFEGILLWLHQQVWLFSCSILWKQCLFRQRRDDSAADRQKQMRNLQQRANSFDESCLFCSGVPSPDVSNTSSYSISSTPSSFSTAQQLLWKQTHANSFLCMEHPKQITRNYLFVFFYVFESRLGLR